MSPARNDAFAGFFFSFGTFPTEILPSNAKLFKRYEARRSASATYKQDLGRGANAAFLRNQVVGMNEM